MLYLKKIIIMTSINSNNTKVSAHNIKSKLIRNTTLFCVCVLCFTSVIIVVMLNSVPNIFLSRKFKNEMVSLGESICSVIDNSQNDIHDEKHINMLTKKRSNIEQIIKDIKE